MSADSRHQTPRATTATVALAIFLLVGLSAATALAADATYHNKPTEEHLIRTGYRFAGEKFEDKFSELPGDETNIRIFKKGQETLGLYILPGGQTYGYAVKMGNQPITAFIDEHNTGFCEKDFGDGESFRIDFAAYRIDHPGGQQRPSRRK